MNNNNNDNNNDDNDNNQVVSLSLLWTEENFLRLCCRSVFQHCFVYTL